MRDMGGKEKKILVIANIPKHTGSDKKPPCVEGRSDLNPARKRQASDPQPLRPPSPGADKMEGLTVIRNRSNSLRLGRLAFYRHLEKVETMRSFWELKHVELKGDCSEVKDFRGKDGKDKSNLNAKGLKTQKKRSPPDSTDSAPLRETLLQDQVEKLNRENTERSHGDPEAEEVGVDGGGGGRAELQELILGEQCVPVVPSLVGEEEKEEQEEVFRDSESELEEEKEEGELKVKKPPGEVEEVEEKKRRGGEGEEGAVTSEQQVLEPAVDIPTQNSESILPSLESSEVAASSKRRVTEEEVKDDLKKSRVEEEEKEVEEKGVEEEERGRVPEGEEPDTAQSHSLESEEVKEDGESSVKEYMIDSSPPPSAPFEHRIVIPKPHQIATFYSINREEVLGGGRFGQVHKCVENSSGLTLAAKIIKGRSLKEKEVVKNEIQVMNQLNHANLIQLYAAFESRHDIILVMEYVDGGELFDRIIDENYNLTELDTVLFIRQISEGLQYMHKMYILHLDLKPENILCVSRVTNKIKIIDFGLARRYKPREKLRVNFGTPEFLAPEVINYEFVSFPTDMWSLGVITYMLLSGLSPFLGDDDNETLNNILACQWNFEEEEFTEISEEAKDFITRLLIKSKSWRMSAAESLRHPWLSDHSLHYRLHQKKNKCHSTHAPPPES
ncbi:myosin light chain kinase family member 4 isoform X2 [Hypomesus transpacificus]|uniref:myosin light chain kinase family member 4 isoform X2 n=1 Tax=Hypomesus transpacificus TaxID=137520 RepID=UPI001F077EFF|nr:myosin light chain kinase family member 4 isoform X2 [Hypomesus transpacificus]